MKVLVRDRKNPNSEPRTVTTAAYAAKGPRVYEKIAMVNDDGTPIDGSPNLTATQAQQQVSRSVKGAAPVVVKTQLVSPKPEPTPQPEPESTPAAQAPAAETGSQEAPAPAQERKKPGPKPGTTRKKSISSNSDENAQ